MSAITHKKEAADAASFFSFNQQDQNGMVA